MSQVEKENQGSSDREDGQDDLDETIVENQSRDGEQSKDATKKVTKPITRGKARAKKERSVVQYDAYKDHARETEEESEITVAAIDTMKVVQLQNELRKLNLSIAGRKTELRERLKNAIEEEINEVEDEEEETCESDTSDEQEEVEARIRVERATTARRQRARKCERDEHRYSGGARVASNFSITDLENSIPYFSGDDKLLIQKWVSNFEDVSVLLAWNDLQKLIYGKRVLKGSAREFISFEDGITSWNILKSKLLAEFKTEVSSATVHAQLFKRKKQPNESIKQYIFAMQGIASQGKVEEEALVECIVDGIQDEEYNKAVLYSACTLPELKKCFKTYERMKEKSEMKKAHNRKDSIKEIKGSRVPTNKKRCFTCGSSEHEMKNCEHVTKGPKCFKCNQFGHIAAKCTTKLESRNPKVSSVSVIEDCSIGIEIDGELRTALVDTGSDVNLIRHEVYSGIKRPTLRSTTRMFAGLGNALTQPTGVLTLKFNIGNDEYQTEAYVVQPTAMKAEVILGREFLKQAELRVSRGRLTIKRLATDSVKEDSINNTEDSFNSAEEEEISNLLRVNYVEQSEIDVVESYREKIQTLIKEHQPVKSVTASVETKIVLTDDSPVCLPPRRLAPKEKLILDQQIGEWLKEGVIRPSQSEYASPVVIVPKKNGSYRVCIDFRQLNRKIIRDRFPMPLIEDRIDALASAKVFSVIDLKNGFFHVPLSKESCKYTAFVTPDAQYEFLKTPFGLSNSPTNFLRFVSEVFKDLIRRKVVLTYMDDIIVPGVDNEDAYCKLKETLKVAAENGLNINWSKCQFLQTRVEFLGYMIENGYVNPSPAKIKAVRHYPEPKTKKDIQQFLGLTGYFRKFVKCYAKIARPLSDLLKGDKSFCFDMEQRQAFNTLKNALTNGPVLRLYRPDSITELHTDASKYGYGAILFQKDKPEDDLHPVYYFSRKTSDAEQKYHSYDLEILAVVRALEKFRVYLLGLKFQLITDCEAFQKTLSKRDLPPRVARWALALQEFEFDIQHRPGERLKHVDALSRAPVMIVEDALLMSIRNQQDEEERLRVIKQLLKDGPYEDYLVENGILMKRAENKNIIVVPTGMYSDIIRRTHENGHFGVRKMTESIKEEYHIPNLKERLDKFISCCIPCILAERKKGKKEGELAPIPKGDTPLFTYHVDHMGPLTLTGKRYKYLFVVVDSFSKYVWLYPTKSTSTKEVIDKLTIQQRNFGNPKRIISDRGTAFTSFEFKEYCADENIDHVTITTGIPRGNGQVERINGIVIPILAKLSLNDPDKWFRHVDKVQRCLNSTYQRSIGMSPFSVLFGTKMRQREDLEVLSLIEQETTKLFDEERQKLRDIAKENLLKVQEENRKLHNKSCKRATTYKEGDLVVIKRTQFGPALKIKAKFLGPYQVSKVKRNHRYDVVRVGEGEGPRLTSTSADFMKPYMRFSSETEDLAGMAECREP